jgi:hypothetical protein
VAVRVAVFCSAAVWLCAAVCGSKAVFGSAEVCCSAAVCEMGKSTKRCQYFLLEKENIFLSGLLSSTVYILVVLSLGKTSTTSYLRHSVYYNLITLINGPSKKVMAASAVALDLEQRLS